MTSKRLPAPNEIT